MKFYIDDDVDQPTICGTGTEDYFGGAWNFAVPGEGYTRFSSPFLGLHDISRPDGLYQAQQRFGMYRWPVLDPVEFSSRLRATLQDLGWFPDGRYLARSDDIASTAFWYSDIAADGDSRGRSTPTRSKSRAAPDPRLRLSRGRHAGPRQRPRAERR